MELREVAHCIYLIFMVLPHQVRQAYHAAFGKGELKEVAHCILLFFMVLPHQVRQAYHAAFGKGTNDFDYSIIRLND